MKNYDSDIHTEMKYYTLNSAVYFIHPKKILSWNPLMFSRMMMNKKVENLIPEHYIPSTLYLFIELMGCIHIFPLFIFIYFNMKHGFSFFLIWKNTKTFKCVYGGGGGGINNLFLLKIMCFSVTQQSAKELTEPQLNVILTKPL